MHIYDPEDPVRQLADATEETHVMANSIRVARELIAILEYRGRPVGKAKETLAKLRESWMPLCNVVGKIGEPRACAMFDLGVFEGDQFPELWPDVVASTPEYVLPCGRVDRLLTHADGSLTVVEIKPPGSRRDQAQGLGQAIMYAASLRAKMNSNVEVRAALFVASDLDQEVENACRSVGVTYLHMSWAEQVQTEKFARIMYQGVVAP